MTHGTNNLVGDLITGFVEDCQEVLARVEPALIRLEAAGDSQDLKLVHNVFQSAHSIKAGAGMLGLGAVKTLAHKLENVLHLLRCQELTPTGEVVSVLKESFSTLDELLNNLPDSENTPTDTQMAKLGALTAAPEGQDRVGPAMIAAGASQGISVDPISLAQATAGGNELFLLEFDLARDLRKQGRTPLEFLRKLTDAGRIVDCMVDLTASPDQGGAESGIPFHVLFATLLAPQHVRNLLKLPQDRVRHLMLDGAGEPAALPATFREQFGAVLLSVSDGAGSIVAPKHLKSHGLDNIHAALLAGLTRCTGVAVDLSGIEQCDVFFFQLLCAAQHSYNAKGLRFSTAGALDADLRKAASTMGFGCNGTPGCLFSAA